MGGCALSLMLFDNPSEAPQMTTGGWAFMIGAWTAILLLVLFSFSRILVSRRRK